MAIDTDNKKLALLEWDNIWEPGLPISPGSLGADDKQQLIHGYPGILWGGITAISNSLVLQWNLLNQVNQSTQLQWNMLNSIDSSVALQWNLLNSVASSTIIQWDISSTLAILVLEERLMEILFTDRIMLINETNRIMDILKKR